MHGLARRWLQDKKCNKWGQGCVDKNALSNGFPSSVRHPTEIFGRDRQILKHSTPRPIEVRAFLEHDVNELDILDEPRPTGS